MVMRVAFFGSPAFALPTLDGLLASNHRVVAAITQPDRPRDRGLRPTAPPVKARATAVGIPVLQPDRLREEGFLRTVGELRPDIGVVAAYGRLLPPPLLQLPPMGLINVHASLLPRWRGAAPVHRAVMAGDAETGVTIMRIVERLDAGPMLARAPRPIDPDETSEDVERDLAVLGARLLVETVDRLAAGPVDETPQDDAQATYAPRLTREDAPIHWDATARRIHDQVRGLHPWPRAAAMLEAQRLIILRTSVDAGEPVDAPHGAIVEARGDALRVAAGDRRTLRILRLQAEGGRAQSVREFLAGRPIAAGQRFT
jgi:methionyl-tRNA formyltransferase